MNTLQSKTSLSFGAVGGAFVKCVMRVGVPGTGPLGRIIKGLGGQEVARAGGAGQGTSQAAQLPGVRTPAARAVKVPQASGGVEVLTDETFRSLDDLPEDGSASYAAEAGRGVAGGDLKTKLGKTVKTLF